MTYEADLVSRLAAARQKQVEAVDAYNARLLLVRSELERGNWSMKVDHEYTAMSEAQSAFIQAAQDIADAALAAEPEVKIMPRGGVQHDWWTEYQLLLRRFKKLAKAARLCVEEVDANLGYPSFEVGTHQNEPSLKSCSKVDRSTP